MTWIELQEHQEDLGGRAGSRSIDTHAYLKSAMKPKSMCSCW